MSTKNYDFPTIDPAAPFDGANDINELATAIDRTMKQVEILGQDAKYTLPTATKTRLGGVIVGNNVNVTPDGTISTDVDPYELPPATRFELGGVKVGGGFSITPDGVLSVASDSVELPAGSVTTEMIADDAVTAVKIAQNTVQFENLSVQLQELVTTAEKYTSGQFDEVPCTPTSPATVNNIKVSTWGPCMDIQLVDYPITGDGSTVEFTLANIAPDNLPTGTAYPMVAPISLMQGAAAISPGTLSYNDYGELKIRFTSAPATGSYTLNDSTMFLFV